MNKDRLEDNLTYIRLGTIRRCYEEQAARAARENLSHLAFFERLIEEEVLAKQDRAAQMRVHIVKFPVTKTLDGFDFEHAQKIPKKRILSLFNLGFVDQKRNVLFVGQPGVGQTHLALALGYQACQKGHSTLFTTAAGVINTLNASLSDHSFPEAMKKHLKPKRRLSLMNSDSCPLTSAGRICCFKSSALGMRPARSPSRPIDRQTSGRKLSITIPPSLRHWPTGFFIIVRWLSSKEKVIA